MTAVAYTDGSCFENGAYNACAGWSYIFSNRNIYEYDSVGDAGTNNRAELIAILRAIQATKRDLRENKLIVKTDSQYCVNCIVSWIDKWKRYAKKDGTWTRPTGEEVRNQDLLKEIEKEKNEGGFHLTATFVKAHTSNATQDTKWNNVADKLAKIPCQEKDANKLPKRARGTHQEIKHIIIKAHNQTFKQNEKKKS